MYAAFLRDSRVISTCRRISCCPCMPVGPMSKPSASAKKVAPYAPANLTFFLRQDMQACWTCFRFSGRPSASEPTNLTAAAAALALLLMATDMTGGRASGPAQRKFAIALRALPRAPFFFLPPPVASGHQAAIGAMSVDGRIQSIDVLWDQRSTHAAASSARLCWSGALATGRTLNRVQTIREAVWWRELEVLGLPPTFSGGGVGLAKFRKAAYLCI